MTEFSAKILFSTVPKLDKSYIKSNSSIKKLIFASRCNSYIFIKGSNFNF